MILRERLSFPAAVLLAAFLICVVAPFAQGVKHTTSIEQRLDEVSLDALELNKCKCDGRKPLILIGCSCVAKRAIQKAHIAAAAAYAAAHRANNIIDDRVSKVDILEMKRNQRELATMTRKAAAAAAAALSSAAEARAGAHDRVNLAKELRTVEKAAMKRIQLDEDHERRLKVAKALEKEERRRAEVAAERHEIGALKAAEEHLPQRAAAQLQEMRLLLEKSKAEAKEFQRVAKREKQKRQEAAAAAIGTMKMAVARKMEAASVKEKLLEVQIARQRQDHSEAAQVTASVEVAQSRAVDRELAKLPLAARAIAAKQATTARQREEKAQLHKLVDERILGELRLKHAQEAMQRKKDYLDLTVKYHLNTTRKAIESLQKSLIELKLLRKRADEEAHRVLRQQALAEQNSAKGDAAAIAKKARKKLRAIKHKESWLLTEAEIQNHKRIDEIKAELGRKSDKIAADAAAAKAAFDADEADFHERKIEHATKLQQMNAKFTEANVNLTGADLATKQQADAKEVQAFDDAFLMAIGNAQSAYRQRMDSATQVLEQAKQNAKDEFDRELQLASRHYKMRLKLLKEKFRTDAEERRRLKEVELSHEQERKEREQALKERGKDAVFASVRVFSQRIKATMKKLESMQRNLRHHMSILTKRKAADRKQFLEETLRIRNSTQKLEKDTVNEETRKGNMRKLADHMIDVEVKLLEKAKAKRKAALAEREAERVAIRLKEFEREQKLQAERLAAKAMIQEQINRALASQKADDARSFAEKIRNKMAAQKREREARIRANGDPVTLESGLTPYRRGFRLPIYTHLEGLVALSGVAHGSDLLAVLAKLPMGPSHTHTFSQITSPSKAFRADITAEGLVRGIDAEGHHPGAGWFSFDGMLFPKKSTPRRVIEPLNGWVNMGGEYAPLSVVVQGSLCVVSGTIKIDSGNVAAWKEHLFTLEPPCRPADGNLAFSVNSFDAAHRVDVYGNGEVHWRAGNKNEPVLSLDGIIFSPESAPQPLSTMNGWTEHGHQCRPPSWRKVGSMCIVTGMAAYTGAFSPIIARLPPACRPNAKLIFGLNHNEETWRVDVFPNGNIKYISGTKRHAYLSLDGLRFVVDGLKADATNVPLLQLASDPVSLIEPWQNAGASFENPRVVRFGEFCLLGGMAKTSKLSATAKLTVLSTACLPSKLTEVSTYVQQENEKLWTQHRADIGADGQVTLVNAPSFNSNGRLTFSGIVFPAKNAHPESFMLYDPWVPYGEDLVGEYSNPRYYSSGGLCVLDGRIKFGDKAASYREVFGRLPAVCQPRDGDLQFGVTHNNMSIALFIKTDGDLVLDHNHPVTDLSLAGIAFFARSAAQPLYLGEPINKYKDFRIPSFRRFGNLCALSGVYRGTSRPIVAVLPESCRPTRDLVFVANNNEELINYKITAQGEIKWPQGIVHDNGIINLNGIIFSVPMENLPADPPIGNDPPPRQGNPKLLSGFTESQQPFPSPAFNLVGEICTLEGRLHKADGDIASNIAWLPPVCRPRKRMVFLVPTSRQRFLRVDVLESGLVLYGGGAVKGDWVSLDGVAFPTAAARLGEIKLHGFWRNYGLDYMPATFSVHKTYCVLSGFVHLRDDMSKWTNEIGKLPIACRPRDGDLKVTIGANEEAQTVRITKSGSIIWMYGGKHLPFLSLAGISFFTESASQRIHERPGFAPAAVGEVGYRRPSFRSVGQTCVLSGVLNSAGQKGVLGSLPSYCTPRGQVTFQTMSGRNNIGLSVYPNGEIHWESGELDSTSEISLDGIRFITVLAAPESEVPVVHQLGTPLNITLHDASAMDNGYAPPSVYKLGSMCFLGGGIAGQLALGPVLQLEKDCTPTKTHVFDAHSSGGQTIRVDVDSNGVAQIGAGSMEGTWMGLGSLVVPSAEAKGTAFKLGKSWEPYGGDFAAPMVYQEGDLCVLSGLARVQYFRLARWNNFIGKLPAECRPREGAIRFEINENSHTLVIEIKPTGSVRYVAGTKAFPYVSLGGVAFFAKSRKPLKLGEGYLVADSTFRPPTWRRLKGICFLSGSVVAGKHHRRVIAYLADKCRPADKLVFAVKTGNGSDSRVEVYPDGRLSIVNLAKFATSGIIPLDGIRFVVPKTPIVPKVRRVKLQTNELSLLHSLTAYQDSYMAPTVSRHGVLCLVNGMAKGSNLQQSYFKLPEWCQSPKRLAFGTLRDDNTVSRTDVFSDGTVAYVTGSEYNQWVDFSGMIFAAKGAVSIAVQPVNGFESFGQEYRQARFFKQEDTIVLSGFLRITGKSSRSLLNAKLLRLPKRARPDTRLVFNVVHDDQFHRINLDPNGWVSYVPGKARKNAYISLDSVAFTRSTGPLLNLREGWRAATAEDAHSRLGLEGVHSYRKPSFKMQGPACFLSGVAVQQNKNQLVIAQLPYLCRPPKTIVVAVNSHTLTIALEINTEGVVSYMKGPLTFGFVSLDGIHFIAQ